MTATKPKRIVSAPQPIFASSFPIPANRILNVELEENENVEWIWTLLPDGTRYVSGYTLVK
ncbi:MAG: hypothetical protein J7647_24585 [Cyanobacteria bacterium SBLK]|nr:hypothetical protein [Cyanobacteria bacterium SBLK]